LTLLNEDHVRRGVISGELQQRESSLPIRRHRVRMRTRHTGIGDSHDHAISIACRANRLAKKLRLVMVPHHLARKSSSDSRCDDVLSAAKARTLFVSVSNGELTDSITRFSSTFSNPSNALVQTLRATLIAQRKSSRILESRRRGSQQHFGPPLVVVSLDHHQRFATSQKSIHLANKHTNLFHGIHGVVNALGVVRKHSQVEEVSRHDNLIGARVANPRAKGFPRPIAVKIEVKV
jgi:hypothetical protein